MELQNLFEAYYDCRRNKRNTINALKFEMHYESNLIGLWDSIQNRTYEVGKSIAFIVEKPVKREIFAGDFRDRIVHHLIINKFNPILEKKFILDSYSCREGKGTLFGIERVKGFIRKATENYTKDTYILKLDVEGFFMSIDKKILLSQVYEIIMTRCKPEDKDILLYLCHKVILNNPTKNCIVKGDTSDWVGLPKTKSLFFSQENKGLPIGNLTSQILANLYMHPLDEFIKKTLKIRYYGRYVDDFILIHEDKQYLIEMISEIRTFLAKNLGLTLHPRKIHLQHYSKGVSFLGAYIKPWRVYVGKRLKTNFYKAIQEINGILDKSENQINKATKQVILAKVNSYLGLMIHFDSFTLRKKYLGLLNSRIWNHFYISGRYRMIVEKRKKIG